MSDQRRWKPPWHCGFGWMPFSVLASIGINHIMNRAFVADVPYWIMVPVGMLLGSFFWASTWQEWYEFGPNWDGGM